MNCMNLKANIFRRLSWRAVKVMTVLCSAVVVWQVYLYATMPASVHADAVPVAVRADGDVVDFKQAPMQGKSQRQQKIQGPAGEHVAGESQLHGHTPNRYTPDWPSLDARPLPDWYDDAKIGIFIHWGVFSVPSFGTEWFWMNWKGRTDRHPEVARYMKQQYPPGFTYAEFAPNFKADLFKPDDWADLFEASGAKYAVLTSKHHEGYTLWPSKVSFNWNSMAVGPKRDLVGALANSLRNRTDLHFGLYHSLYEWYNPLYMEDKANGWRTQRFVLEKTLPELYELVRAYKPDVVWSDGDWEAPHTYWNSTEFLAWLYNDSPVRNTVVTNDRWGNKMACHHGGYYTCYDRYNPGVLLRHKWENCMTIDHKSWGYRREATLADYLSTHDVITTLVETVSCGGNILINIGPTASGTIIPIYEERLRQLGAWLKVNGEAIYSSRPWSHQNDSVTQQVWYTSKKQTCTPGDHSCHPATTVYAITLTWPTSQDLLLSAPTPATNTIVTLLGYQGPPIKWSRGTSGRGRGLTLHLPIIPFHQMPCEWAWTFKMTDIG